MSARPLPGSGGLFLGVPMKNKKKVRLLILLAVSALTVILAIGGFGWKLYQARQKDRISYTAFIEKVNAGAIASVAMEGDVMTATGKAGETFRLVRPADAEISKLLLAKHIDISARTMQSRTGWIELSIGLFLLVPVLFIMKRMNVLGRSRARTIDPGQTNTLFADVAGADEAKIDLIETVEFLKNPQRFGKLGGQDADRRAARGASGHGKDAPCPGSGRRGRCSVLFPVRVRSSSRCTWAWARHGSAISSPRAKKAAPCIIFIDELDAVDASGAIAGSNGANDERDQTLNQLLVEMDGFSAESGDRRHRRHQPARDPGPGAASPRPLRPSGGCRLPGYQGTRGDPEGPYPHGAARAGGRSADHCAGNARASPAPTSPIS